MEATQFLTDKPIHDPNDPLRPWLLPKGERVIPVYSIVRHRFKINVPQFSTVDWYFTEKEAHELDSLSANQLENELDLRITGPWVYIHLPEAAIKNGLLLMGVVTAKKSLKNLEPSLVPTL